MRSTIVIVVLLLLAVYAIAQVGTMYRAKDDLKTFAERTLDFVDETTKDSVKVDIVQTAHKLGIEVAASNIDVVYEDADEPSVAQRLVGGRLGAQFINKRVVISLRYVAPVLGLPVHQQITASKIKPVAAPVIPPTKTTQELLDSR
ncbi:MAG: hypothetical protein WCG79_07500 [Verrucomicrobiota bacterium]